MTVALAVLGYCLVGGVCCFWIGRHRIGSFPDDKTLIAVMLFWPLWLIGWNLAHHGWRQR